MRSSLGLVPPVSETPLVQETLAYHLPRHISHVPPCTPPFDQLQHRILLSYRITYSSSLLLRQVFVILVIADLHFERGREWLC